VLDAGCGVGGSAIWLAKEYGAEVVGITPVASQVDRARRYAREHGVADRIRFEQQDYTATTFAAESFDVVWALESFCHEPEKPRILVEARRLLRPGGRLGAAEYMRRCERYPAPDERLLETWLSGWAIPSLATAKQWLTWTTSNGFVDAQVLDVTQNVLPSLRRLYWITVFLWPLTIVLRAIRVRSKAQQGNVRGALQQYRALQRDLWGYGLLTATAPPS
jgi:cyclopropane fatty-acyl-phospholipid synthase-like methyltransferase